MVAVFRCLQYFDYLLIWASHIAKFAATRMRICSLESFEDHVSSFRISESVQSIGPSRLYLWIPKRWQIASRSPLCAEQGFAMLSENWMSQMETQILKPLTPTKDREKNTKSALKDIHLVVFSDIDTDSILDNNSVTHTIWYNIQYYTTLCHRKYIGREYSV